MLWIIIHLVLINLQIDSINSQEAPKVSIIMQSSNVLLSTPIIIVCTSTGHPAPTIRWKINKIPIVEMMKNSVKKHNFPRIYSLKHSHTSSLIITKLISSDSNSMLSCEADNVAGKDSRHQKLTVLSRDKDTNHGFPSFQNNFFPIVKSFNSNVSIVCQAQGFPLPMIQWFKNYELILEKPLRVKIFNDGTLFLSHISRDDKGVYHCQAQNINGLLLSDPSTLEVANFPVTPKYLKVEKCGSVDVDISWKSGSVDSGDNENFILHYQEVLENKSGKRFLPRTLSFPKNEKPAEFKYQLNDLFPYTNYNLWLESENELGVSLPTEVVGFKTLATPPQDVPRSITATSISNTAVLVAWKPPKRQYGKFINYHVIYSNDEGYRLQHWRTFNSKIHEVMLTHLTSSETYYIRVKIINEKGHGPISKKISIITKAGSLSQCPDFRITEIFLSHIKLEWGTPDPTKQYKEIQFNLQCFLTYLSKNNSTGSPSKGYLMNRNLSMNKMSFSFPIINISHISCNLSASNGVGSGMLTKIEASTINKENSKQKLFNILKIGSSFIYFKWKPPSNFSSNFILWVFRISSFNNKVEIPDIPEVKLNLSSSIPSDPNWFNYNFTQAVSSSQYILGLRYLLTDENETLREYVHRSEVITTQKSSPSDSPKDLQTFEMDSKRIKITWKPPVPIYQNGEITHYELRYYSIGKEDETERFINVTEPHAILTNLVHSQYKIFVRAFTKVGPGIWSNPKYIYPLNMDDFPVPIKVNAYRSSDTEIQVTWSLPPLTDKIPTSPSIAGFIILYSPVGGPTKWSKHTPQGLEFTTKIKGLDINTKYQIKVAAVNYLGITGNFSDIVEDIHITIPKMNLKTIENLRCSVQSSKMLKVEWDSPSITTDIVKFEIIYSGSLNYISAMGLKKAEYIDKKKKSLDFEPNVKGHFIKLDDLQSNAIYKIAVRPVYVNENSFQSHLETTCRTYSSAPDFVEAPVILGLNKLKDQVIIKLFRSSEKNGPISNYSVIVGAFQSADYKKLSLLKDPESYSFIELSVNTKPNSYTGEYIAISKGVNEIFKTSGKNFSKIFLGDEKEVYGLKLVAVNKRLVPDYYYKCFMRVCLQGPSSSFCKSSEWSKPFILSKMIMESNKFQPHANNGSKNLNIKSDYSALNNSIMIIIFLLCGAILATAFIIVGCVIKRRKSKKRFMNLNTQDDARSSIMMKSTMLNGVISEDKIFLTTDLDETRNNSKKFKAVKMKSTMRSAPDLVAADSVLMCQDGSKMSPVLFENSKKLRISSPNIENNVERPPIQICNLFQYVRDLKANDSVLLQSEFETLNTNLDDRFTWQRSNIDSNKSKNRYANVVAYDHTSVLLTMKDDVIGSDYINANYIDGYQKPRAYIATQGPLPDTTDDFWRMVWEQKSSCIVMMTRLEERSGVKCHQYWPNRGFICYGQMIVSHIDTFCLAYYTIRLFEVRHSKFTEKRNIQHFQFTAWPDHGVPKLHTPLLMFIRRVRSIGKGESEPKIVHCSAGVGRTGAFIVVDSQLERIKQEKTIDVFNYVSKIRCQRNYMVQTQAQYQFILETLLEAVEDGNTEVLACNFHPHVTKLSQIGISGTNQLSGFEMEFSKLNSLASNRGRHGVMLADFVKAAGNQTVNLTKNRVRNIIPYDWNRVPLNAIRGIDGSDYINASYIDGYRDRKSYIAAQSPIPSTVEDFWRMIWDQHCGVVIVLNQPHEDKSHIYWPVNKSIRYQFFVVDPVVEYNMLNYILREFKITDARDGEFRSLRQFQFTQWPTHGCPKEAESILDFIRQVHKTKEQFGHMEPMVVHCSTGSGRTGVFIALSIVLDRLQQESVVDMYQTVKLLHKQRIGLVQTEEQYEFCYMAALDYLSNYEKMIEKSDLY